jgi:hypothetical protein
MILFLMLERPLLFVASADFAGIFEVAETQ